MHPGPDALVHAQDKIVMRERLDRARRAAARAGARCRARRSSTAFAAEVGLPLVLKTPRGGYDGKGVARRAGRCRTPPGWLAGAASRLLAEERVPFRRELAVLVARSPHGQAVAWPVVETVQVDGICREVVAPAPRAWTPTSPSRRTDVALTVAGELGVVGVLAVEMFEMRRPDGGAGACWSTSWRCARTTRGHWTIDGAVTSQFEQHLRAVLDLPLGRPAGAGAAGR